MTYCSNSNPYHNTETTISLINIKNIEFNTSMSDDSGLPYTSSSLSSDSSRLGIEKFENEVDKSEVSQHRNSNSDNFDTVKKCDRIEQQLPGKQDFSIRSGLLKNFAYKLTKSLIINGISTYSQFSKMRHLCENEKYLNYSDTYLLERKSFQNSKSLYFSDTLLHCHIFYKNDENSSYENRTTLDRKLNRSSKSCKHNRSMEKSSKRNRKSKNHSKCFLLNHQSRSNVSVRTVNSLNKRLSSSHNSLSDSIANKADDSIFITQAMSHDALDDRKILDFYNVPLDSDIYAAPIDFIRAKYTVEDNIQPKSLRDQRSAVSRSRQPNSIEYPISKRSNKCELSTQESAGYNDLQLSLIKKPYRNTSPLIASSDIKFKKHSAKDAKKRILSSNNSPGSHKKSNFSINLKQKFCSIFRISKQQHYRSTKKAILTNKIKDGERKEEIVENQGKIEFSMRKLPPLPNIDSKTTSLKSKSKNKEILESRNVEVSYIMDFAANIEKVKEYGWYWGPISSEGAEKILSNEPDGSFLVRDSSDDHYIFSLTFKLNGSVRHVRIDHDQGSFSFGSCAKFKSRTIMEFIENAVEHSRSGRYLFFLHRRPEHGPMRVQLTNPVSRFKHIQSLQHMCRFIILKTIVRKDLIQTLPLPRRVIDYLSYKNCLSEHVETDTTSPANSETEL